MHWWKQHPPGWFAWDRWEDPEGEDSGGDGGGDNGDSGDNGDNGGGGDSGGDNGDSGDSGGDSGGGWESDSGGDSGDSGGDSGGGDWESDGDAGDNGAVQREWEAEQRRQEQDFERERERQDQERADQRAQEEMERERQRLEEERRRQEEERQRAEAEAERQRQLADQQRLADSYRLQQAQQQGVNLDPAQDLMLKGETPEPPPVPGQSEYVILTHKQTGAQSRLPRNQLPYMTNADEFRIEDDPASSPLQLQPQDRPPEQSQHPSLFQPHEAPFIENPEQQATTAPPAVQGQPSVLGDTGAPPVPAQPSGTVLPNQAHLFNPEPAQQPAATVPEQAAQNAAAAVAATGASPETVAATAELAARMASDRQTLAMQSPWTRAIFRSEYGDQADQEWVRQHEAELARNERLYGSREPAAGTNPLSTAPAGTPVAPNRQIGVVPAPSPGETARYGVPGQRAAAPGAVPPAPSAAAPANTLGVGSIGNVPAPTQATTPSPTPTQAPGTTTPAPGANGWTPLPGQTPRPVAAPTTLPGTTAPSGPPPTAGEPGGPPLANTYPVLINPQGDIPPPTAGEPGGPPLAQTAPVMRENPLYPGNGQTTIVSAIGPDDQFHTFTPGEWSQQDPEVKNQYRDVSLITIDAQGNIVTPQQRGAEGQSDVTTLHTPEIVTTVQQATYANSPIDALASMALLGKGEVVNTENVRRDSYNIAQGIAGMLSGKPEASWAEPYLNDIARLAWAREEASNGRTSDPRDAPVDYIEHWKDAFYGSDPNVPMVKELDQQMIDYAAFRTPPGQPFKWQEAFGPNGDRGLISRQVTAVDCGPNAWATIMRSRGYNVDPAQSFPFAVKYGYHNGSEFTGPQQMVNMLNKEAGLQAEMQAISPNGSGWDRVDQELSEGRPVILSSPGHYWVISAKDPATGKYYAGATTLRGNPEWMMRGGFTYGGAANQAIFTRGDVDPNSRAVKELGLKPPAGTGAPADTRRFLSLKTQYDDQQPAAPSGTARLSAQSNDSGHTMLMSQRGPAYRYDDGGAGVSDENGSQTPPDAQQTVYPLADDPRNRAATTENVWSPRQPARQGLMQDYQALPYADREAAFNRALDEGIAAEGITGEEAQRWKNALYEIATGTGRLKSVPGENPALNPYMIAGESSGEPGTANRLSSSATGYFQMIQSNRDGSDFAFMGYVPKEYNGDIYNPVAQVRQVVRAIKSSSNFRGNPDAAVADKLRKGHWDLVVQKREPW